MNRKEVISYCCTVTVLFFFTSVSAGTNKLSVQPTVPSSKVKITAPSPAPPALVAPTKTKAPVSQPAVSTETPKPAPPKVSVKQPKPSTPKVSVKKPRLSAPKPVTAPASLPRSIGRSGLPQAYIPKDLGKAVNIRRDLGKNNSISGRMPEGLKTPGGGFGATGAGAGYAKGFSQGDGVGSAMYDRSGLEKPRFVQGSGEHIQGQETEGNVTYGKYTYAGIPSDEAVAIQTASEHGYSDDDIAYLYEEYLIAVDVGETDGATHSDDDTSSKPSTPAKQDPQSVRTFDGDDPDGTIDGKHIDPNRVKSIFAGGIRFAPGEEGGEGGDINPGLLGEISSNQTQIHFVEGAVPKSTNFEDLSKQIQDAIKKGGPGDHIIE